MRLCLGCYYRCSRRLDTTTTIELHVEPHGLFWLSLFKMRMAKPGIYPFLRRVNTLVSGVEQKLGIFLDFFLLLLRTSPVIVIKYWHNDFCSDDYRRCGYDIECIK